MRVDVELVFCEPCCEHRIGEVDPAHVVIRIVEQIQLWSATAVEFCAVATHAIWPDGFHLVDHWADLRKDILIV